MHSSGYGWPPPGAPDPYAPLPSLSHAHLAHSGSPTSLVPQHGHHLHGGALWVDAPAPSQAYHAPAQPPHSAAPTHGLSQLAFDPASDGQTQARLNHDATYARQYHDGQRYASVQYTQATPQQAPPPDAAYSPQTKRRRLSHPSHLEAMYAHHHPQQQQQQQQEQQQSRHQAPMWEESYAQGEVEGRMSPPASGTAVRRQSDTLQRVRRSSSTAQNPAEVEALLWNLGTPSSAAETAEALALSQRSSFAAPPSTAASLAQPAPAPAPSCTAAGPAPSFPVVDPGRQQSASASNAPPPKTARARQPRDDAGQAGLADKSCKQCRCVHCDTASLRECLLTWSCAGRIRKVRCSRTWPVCGRCTIKELPCHYGNLVPSRSLVLPRLQRKYAHPTPAPAVDLVKTMQPEARVAELEARISMSAFARP